MGGPLDEDCVGQGIIAALNQVFGTPGSTEYNYAHNNNTFDTVTNTPGNASLLTAAYKGAMGTNYPSGQGWSIYLSELEALNPTPGPDGQQQIYDIAQYRLYRLQNSKAMKTKTHTPHAGGHMHYDGNVNFNHDANEISAPVK
ncbi:MAG TPA: hypothetical protein VKI44_36940 [Acetobacteraceae bacterium]|nr:hypothetical protein [Acetobacteraceae bacterium]